MLCAGDTENKKQPKFYVEPNKKQPKFYVEPWYSVEVYTKKNETRHSRGEPHTNHIINNTKTNNHLC